MKRPKHAFLLVFWLVLNMPNLLCAQVESDSLRKLLTDSTDINTQISILKQLSLNAIEESDYASAVYYLNLESDKQLTVKDSAAWANSLYNLGMVNSIIRQFDKAGIQSITALNFFQSKGMHIQAANTCINLGYIHYELKMPDQAFNYYQKAAQTFEAQLSHQQLESSYLNLGMLGGSNEAIYNFKDQYDKAYDVIYLFNSSSLSKTYLALSTLSIQKEDLPVAENYAMRGLELAEKNGNQRLVADAQIQIGKVYFKQGRQEEAFDNIEKGLIAARRMNEQSLAMEAYAELAKISIAMDRPTLAYNYLDHYVRIKDSTSERQLMLQLNHKNRAFEVARTDLSIENLLRENIVKTNVFNFDRELKIGLVVTLVIILLLSGYYFKRYYVKARQAGDLKKKNEVIEDQKNKLEQLIFTKDRFLSIIAHDLKNPFNSLLGFADLAYNDFDEITDSERKSYLNVIRQSGQQIYALLDNLLTWSRAQSGRIDFNPEPVNLNETIENAIELVRSSADNKQVSLFTDFTKEVIVKADKNMLSAVLRNILTNAIKFTPNGGSVTLSSKLNGKSVHISVTDSGVGMNEEELSRLFKVDGNLKNAGTNNETGTGLGLILCQEFMSLHKSKIEAKSTAGKGSTFSFQLDIVN